MGSALFGYSINNNYLFFITDLEIKQKLCYNMVDRPTVCIKLNFVRWSLYETKKHDALIYGTSDRESYIFCVAHGGVRAGNKADHHEGRV